MLKEIRAISKLNISMQSIRQGEAKGLGHAILCARRLIGKEPFAVILPDMLISKDLYFAASLPRSVECRQSGVYRNPQPIKETIIWKVNGKKEYASQAKVSKEYGEKMEVNGANRK